MPRNKEEIAGIIRNTMITKHGYKAESDYVRKPITENFGIWFYHTKENTLCICIYHKEGSQFSPRQQSIILEVLARPEFISSYSEAEVSESTDGRTEMWAPLKIKDFDVSWSDTDIANWVVRFFEHFITTVELLELN
jgi:hypothetical protein